MTEALSILGWCIIGVGLFFDLVGCLGLVRLPDVYNRLQAATKCVTLGTCAILLGVFIVQGISAAGLKALLCIVFVALTAPVGAHAIARASHRAGVKPTERMVRDDYAGFASGQPEEGGDKDYEET